jgi:uncharacterized glyoxalase superfamily metalloenzyme YdcJ
MTDHLHGDEIRTLFSSAMSDMYRTEVPQYGTLIDLVAKVNDDVLGADPALRARMQDADELDRLTVERHGAIRLGTAGELSAVRRMFAVMGMFPVGYYDLSVAGLPVHSTAFRPIDPAALSRNPFRVFTSLVRLELLPDRDLADTAAQILSRRQIVTDGAMRMIRKAETDGGLTRDEAAIFVAEALQTFRWHARATVDAQTYARLHDAHRLIADVVCFRGPHINHLTPRTLDIDAVQAAMPAHGIAAKAVIEGPPRRDCPILLRQTAFKALEERVIFDGVPGSHTARFGEIEQRGAALTPAGRDLYDRCLAWTRADVSVGADGRDADDYVAALNARFADFPDDPDGLRRAGLARFRYRATCGAVAPSDSVDQLIASGHLAADPLTYEDFLPVSAAGIFQSNLGTDGQSNYDATANRDAFEQALGATVTDPDDLYERAERNSLTDALNQLGQGHLLPGAPGRN